MGLFKPKWAREDLKGEKLGDAIFEVRKMTSQGKLLEVALRAHNWQVRNQAIERLDEDGLKKVALLSPNGEAAEKAIFRIGDQAFLARVALGQESVASERAMAAAAIRIEDQELLATVARTSPDADARVAAADRMPYMTISFFIISVWKMFICRLRLTCFISAIRTDTAIMYRTRKNSR